MTAESKSVSNSVSLTSKTEVDAGPESTRAVHCARGGDVFSLGAMMARQFLNNIGKHKSAADKQRWIERLSRQCDEADLLSILMNGRAVKQQQALRDMAHLIWNMLQEDRHLRISASRAAMEMAQMPVRSNTYLE